MPRKRNGFGASNSFSVRSISNDINKGKKIQGSGQYPSNRQFGTSVTRSAIQKWNIDSSWQRWRKGYEYARQNIWVNLNILFFAFLFSGTTSRVRTNFRCKRFPSLLSDSATRYVVKREIAPSSTDPRFATVTQVINTPPPQSPETDDEKQRAKNFQNEEIWLKLSPDADPTVGNVIKRLTHERVTNKRHGDEYTTTKTFEATVKNLLKNNGRPMVYESTAESEDTVLTIKIPRNDILNTAFVQNSSLGLSALVGEVIRITNVPITMPKTGLTFTDETYTTDQGEQVDNVKVKMDMTLTNQNFWLADITEQTPFEIFVDVNPLLILEGSNASVEVKQSFRIDKANYQSYFDFYITSQTIDDETEEMSSIFPPLYIADVSDDGVDIVFTTIPFEGQLCLYGNDSTPYMVLSDFSFTSWQKQPNTLIVRGEEVENPSADYTYNDTSVFPWQDETWIVGDGIYIADAYACNCQSYSKSTVTSPEALYRRRDGAALIKNRQLRFPLPSAMSNKDDEGLDNREATVITHWASRQDRLKHKTCKHCIASTFAEEVLESGFVGNIDASTDEILTLNSKGVSAGFEVGQSLLPATAGRAGFFFVVSQAGSSIESAPGVAFEQGDKCFCIDADTGWIRLAPADIGVPGSSDVIEGDTKKFYVVEPNTLPSGIDIGELENKIIEQTKTIDFSESGARSEISPIDFAFSTLQLLNSMNTNIGSTLMGTIALVPVTSNEDSSTD